MSLATVLAMCALLGSVVLLIKPYVRAWAVAGIIAAGLEVAMAFGVVHLRVAKLPLGAILGGILAVVGVIAYFKVTERSAVAAATVVALIGVLQVLRGLAVI